MKTIFKFKYIVIVLLLMIALSFSFVTRTKSFDYIVKEDLQEATDYVVSLMTWNTAPETFNYKINQEEASRIIDFLNKHTYKRNLTRSRFQKDDNTSYYTIELVIANEGKATKHITLYPDGTIMYKNNTYKMQFADSISAKKSQDELESLHQWLLELEEEQ